MEFLQITLTGWVALSIALSMAFLAGLMFILGNERSHYVWGVFCVAVTIWAGGFYMVSLAHNPQTAVFWWRISFIGIILNPFLYFQFALEFVGNKLLATHRMLVSGGLYLAAAVFLFLDIATNLIVNKVTFLFGDIYFDTPPGPLYLYFMTLFLLLVCWALFIIFNEYRKRKSDFLFRQRSIYLFIASAIAYVGGSMNFLPVYGIEVPPTTAFAVAFGAIVIAYAILRHGLFEVRVVTAQSLALILVIFTLVRLFMSGSIQETIFNLLMLAATLAVGIYLILNVRKEIEQRERSDNLAKEVEDKNGKLNEKTLELNKQLAEIEKMNKYMVDRELKMVELKKEKDHLSDEVAELRKRIG